MQEAPLSFTQASQHSPGYVAAIGALAAAVVDSEGVNTAVAELRGGNCGPETRRAHSGPAMVCYSRESKKAFIARVKVEVGWVKACVSETITKESFRIKVDSMIDEELIAQHITSDTKVAVPRTKKRKANEESAAAETPLNNNEFRKFLEKAAMSQLKEEKRSANLEKM